MLYVSHFAFSHEFFQGLRRPLKHLFGASLDWDNGLGASFGLRQCLDVFRAVTVQWIIRIFALSWLDEFIARHLINLFVGVIPWFPILASFPLQPNLETATRPLFHTLQHFAITLVVKLVRVLRDSHEQITIHIIVRERKVVHRRTLSDHLVNVAVLAERGILKVDVDGAFGLVGLFVIKFAGLKIIAATTPLIRRKHRGFFHHSFQGWFDRVGFTGLEYLVKHLLNFNSLLNLSRLVWRGYTARLFLFEICRFFQQRLLRSSILLHRIYRLHILQPIEPVLRSALIRLHHLQQHGIGRFILDSFIDCGRGWSGPRQHGIQ